MSLHFLVSCISEERKTREDEQHKMIETYILKLDDQEVEYVRIMGDLYRITAPLSPDEASRADVKVELQDSIYVNYVMSVFDPENGRGEVFLSNIEEEASVAGLNLDVLASFGVTMNPLGIKYGNPTDLVMGFNYALDQSLEGVKYNVVVPFEYGFGDKDSWVNAIPPYSTLFIEYTVVKIKK